MSLISSFRPRSTRVSSLPSRSEPRQRRGHKPTAVHEDGQETERDDDHSIITPSKHTPKAFRAIKGVSLSTSFSTNLLPGITFESDLYVLTGKSYGAIEVAFSTGLCGVAFSLNRPFAVLAENICELCRDNFQIPFLTFMAWSLIHAAWQHYLLAIINAHDWPMRYVTTFTTEVFSLLNSIIYFHKAIQELERAHQTLSFAAFLYAVIGAVGTMLLAIFLSAAESWKPLFHRYIRMGLTEYAVAISTIVFIGLPHVSELANLDKMTFTVSESFKPSDPECSRFIVKFWELPAQWALAAIIPGVIITILFFFDHEVSSIISRGFAWDIVLLCTTTALCGILGIPPANGLLPQAPLHSESLMHSENEQRTIIVDGEEKRNIRGQAPPFMKVLGLTPTSVLAGLFMFMGEQSLAVKQVILNLRLRYFKSDLEHNVKPYIIRPSISSHPHPSSHLLPPTLAKKQSMNTPNKKNNQRPSYSPVHLYTILQIITTVAIFILTLTRGAPAFPLLIISLVPFHLLVMK
ncbi:hypothetical protein BDW59DRAFT_174529 [Aspergillus cavernicola]|uniref:Bicarbonate transporter-like transmembrane domain-containing protein n=1 Tax=Aspergillus cavernicola TaxID=176166 RepID=A0ABR4HYD7_9EURO